MISIRPLESFDEPLLRTFLALAAHESDIEVVLANPALALYVEEWGRNGDCAVVAEDMETRTIVGMAWARFWTNERHGFGWVDALTPEMAIAVEPWFQGQGIGGHLIEAIKEQLLNTSLPDHQGKTFPPRFLSLNVRAESPAVRLYQRHGFTRVEGSERQNRTGGISFNMLAQLW